MEKGIKTNFVDLITEYKICIPTIQRDYIQGRRDKKTMDLSNGLVKNIIDRLNHGDSCHLNFTVGVKSSDDMIFLLDGQQRITTLFLLHFYVALKANKIDDFISLIGYDESETKRFIYMTRNTTQRFMNDLVLNSKLFNKKAIDSNILQSNWFSNDYQDDISIKSMIHMLSLIERHYAEQNNVNYNNEYDSLFNKKNVTFFFLLDEKITNPHEHYIKINSRGKNLTDYELFKSSFFEKMDYYVKKNIIEEKAEKEIKEGLDNKWFEFFWNLFSNDENSGYYTDALIRRFIHTLFTSIELANVDKKDDNDIKLFEKRYGDLLYSFNYEENYAKNYCMNLLNIINTFIKIQENDVSFFNYYIKQFLISENDVIIVDRHLSKVFLFITAHYLNCIDIDSIALNEIKKMIVIFRNIVSNDDDIDVLEKVYNRCRCFSMLGKADLSSYDDNLISKLHAFNQNLLNEEKEKYDLCTTTEVFDSISNVEKELAFFNGRIHFLIELTKNICESTFDKNKFIEISKKALFFTAENYNLLISYFASQFDYCNSFSISGDSKIFTLGYNDTQHYKYHWRGLFNTKYDIFKDPLLKILGCSDGVEDIINQNRNDFISRNNGISFINTIVKYPELLNDFMNVNSSKYGRFWKLDANSNDNIYLMQNTKKAVYTHYKLLYLLKEIKNDSYFNNIEVSLIQNEEGSYKVPLIDLSHLIIKNNKIYYRYDNSCFYKDESMTESYIYNNNNISSIQDMIDYLKTI